MKKVLPVLLAVVLMLSLSVSAFAASMTPSVDKTSIKAGEQVTVTLSLDEDIGDVLTIAYKLYFDASLFDITSSESKVVGGYVTMSTIKTNAKGSYVNLSTMDTTSQGQTLKAGDFAQVTFTAKADAAPGQAAFTAEFENCMLNDYTCPTHGAGPAATVTVTRDYSVTLPEGFTGAATVGHGEDYTFTAQQDPHYDYSFTGSTMGGDAATVVNNGDGTFKVTGVTGNLVIHSNRTPKTYTVTVTGTGAADAAAVATAAYATDYTFTLNKDANYDYTVAATIGGKDCTPALAADGKTYTIPGTSITGNIVIHVTKTQKAPATTTIGFTGSGSSDVAGGTSQTAENGKDFTFTVDEKEGYTYTVKLGNEILTKANGQYTIPGARLTGTALTVTVEKTEKLPEITTTTIGFTGSGSGDVAGGKDQTATNGTDFTFTIDEKAGYTYTVKLGNETLTKTNGQYTIPGAKITGTALTVTVEKTEKAPEITTTTIGFVGSGSGDVDGGKSQTAENGKDFTFTVDEKEGYTYTVKLGDETLTKTNGQYTIPAAKLTGTALTVTVEKTAKTGEKPLPTPVGPKPEKPEKPSEPGTTEPTEPGTTEPTKPAHSFDDVPAGAYYEEAVAWAAEKGITEGTSATTFAPKALCTRAQVVTFLWRAAGCPEPQNAGSFADVTAGSYYAKAVAWAIENGITGGTGDGMFSPDAVCTRAQAVTFLYRASAAPAVDGSSSFSDVDADAYYMAAVRWAEQNGITGGIGDGMFSPDAVCTRAQAVTFLYRASAAPAVDGSSSFSDVDADAYYMAAVRWAEQNGITGGIGGGLFGSDLDCTREQIVTFIFRMMAD